MLDLVLVDRDRAVPGVDRLERRDHEGLEGLARAHARVDDLVVAPEQLVLESAQDLVHHRLLGVEVVVEAAGQDARPRRRCRARWWLVDRVRRTGPRRGRGVRRGGPTCSRTVGVSGWSHATHPTNQAIARVSASFVSGQFSTAAECHIGAVELNRCDIRPPGSRSTTYARWLLTETTSPVRYEA